MWGKQGIILTRIVYYKFIPIFFSKICCLPSNEFYVLLDSLFIFLYFCNIHFT
jgi:hypothetical protein